MTVRDDTAAERDAALAESMELQALRNERLPAIAAELSELARRQLASDERMAAAGLSRAGSVSGQGLPDAIMIPFAETTAA